MEKGQKVKIISDDCRLPKGTVCVIEEVVNETHSRPYYIYREEETKRKEILYRNFVADW